MFIQKKRKRRRSSRKRAKRSFSSSDFASSNKKTASAKATLSGGDQSRRKKKNTLFPALIVLAVLFFSFFFFSEKKQPENSLDSATVHQSTTEALTMDERIKQKLKDIKLKQDVKSQSVLSERFKQPVGPIDPLQPELPPEDISDHFDDSASMEEVFRELDAKPFENEKEGQDPETITRKHIVHQEWLDRQLEILRDKDEQEKNEFIKNFVETVRQQGYKARFTDDMRVILEPIEEEESEEEKIEFEEVKINWK